MQVLLFYLYTTVHKPEEVASEVRAHAERLGLLGRVIVAEEGINGTLEGKTESTEEFASWILSLPEFASMQIKRSVGNGKAFPKLKVKVRTEIVGTRFPKHVDPRLKTGTHLSPHELRTWFERGEDFTIVDMRNSYEFVSGHFKDSIDPGLENSRDLPEAVGKLENLKDKKVLTVCTGGVRCEKMSAYLLDQGFKEVYQLDGGMHAYMEKYPAQDFVGTLYTFDTRVTMDFGGEREIIGTCEHCGAKTERYVNCGVLHCNMHYLACDSCILSDRSAPCIRCEKKQMTAEV